MFEYFPGNYSWNMAVLMAIQLGGQISEIDGACRPLREKAAAPGANADAEAQAAWASSWLRTAQKIESLGRRDQAGGHLFSAAGRLRRAAVYYMTAERFLAHRDDRKMAAYEAMLDCFADAVSLGGERLETVGIPYEGVDLPALFAPADTDGPAPCLINFDGFDVVKEWFHLCGVAEALNRRGISVLMVDHPGVGGAIRYHGLTAIVETERPAAACIDYLESRADVDSSRIGIIAPSLGGYFAPRAAAFEPRLACCIAWGARWDNAGSHGRILRDPSAARSVPGWLDHALWVYGQETADGCAAMIDRMTLEGIADRIRCPILVAHGENDRQVPIDQAHRTIAEAVNSPRRDLRIFTSEEGGIEHCGVDNLPVQIDYMADWAADVLGGRAGPG